MGKVLNEKEIKKQLNIKDFNAIPKEKVMQFVSMIPYMDPDVAKKAIEQFPNFAKVALGALQDYKGIMDKALDANDKEAQKCFEIYDKVVDALKACLQKENIPFEEKKYYIDMMMEIVRMADKKAAENKRFNWELIGMAAGVVVAVLGIGASILGGNAGTKS